MNEQQTATEEAKSAVARLVRHLDALSVIGELIRTQDNRITDAPIFIVQQRRREWGYDSAYCDDYKWLETESGDYCEADAEQVELLEEKENELFESTDPWEKRYYKDHWDFVTACFTEQGCKDYIARNGHNLKEPRIYADGSYRNEEWRTVRKALMDVQQLIIQPRGVNPLP